MNFLKKKRGMEYRIHFGGGSTQQPTYVSPSNSKRSGLTASETKREKRYEESMIPFEDIYNQTPELFKGYAEEAQQLYPQRRERATALEEQLYGMLPNVNVLSPEFQQEAQNRYDIRKQRGLETFKEMYEPLERQITGRAFQNYGGLESSAYRDLQGHLMDERAEGLRDYVNQMELQRQQEEAQQLAMQQQGYQSVMDTQNLYNMLTQEYPAAIGSAAELGKGGTALYNDLINAMRNRAVQGAALANQFNLQSYQNQLAAQQAQQNRGLGYAGLGLSALGALM